MEGLDGYDFTMGPVAFIDRTVSNGVDGFIIEAGDLIGEVWSRNTSISGLVEVDKCILVRGQLRLLLHVGGLDGKRQVVN